MDYIKMTNVETKRVNLVAVKADDANASLEGLAKANSFNGEELINYGKKVEVRNGGKVRFFTELIKVEEEDEFDGLLPGDLVT